MKPGKVPLSVDEVISNMDDDCKAVFVIDAWVKWPMRIIIGAAVVWIVRALVVAQIRGVLHP